MRLFYAIRLDLSIGRDKIVKRIADYPRSRFLTLVIRGCALVQKVKTLLRRFCFPFLFIQCVLDDLFFGYRVVILTLCFPPGQSVQLLWSSQEWCLIIVIVITK